MFGKSPAALSNSEQPAGSLQATINSNSRLQQQKSFQEAIQASPHVQRQKALQGAMDASPRVAQRQVATQAIAKQAQPARAEPNKTGLPAELKAGVETLSGFSMDDVRVHYNSAEPAQLQAHAYAQGTDIHIATGQEKHLPHEAWHVVQQKQERVQAQKTINEQAVNDDDSLEREATVMGAKALRTAPERQPASVLQQRAIPNQLAQLVAVKHYEKPRAPLGSGSTGVVQAARVSIARAGNAIDDDLLATAIEEMREIVEAAEAHNGAAQSGEEYKRLQALLQHQTVANTLPQTSNGTFGLGGSNYFGTTPFTSTQGSADFSGAVSALPESGSTEALGNRKTAQHDEMLHITKFPGLQALASSQGHCLFCYGTIHKRGYQHGTLRGYEGGKLSGNPWPQDWKHDYLGFTLKLTSARMDTIGYETAPVILIQSDSFGERRYFVTR
ncbi:DUF4157 domain-containing protein [Hymenobacter sp. BT662]|uniref:DUF4157 domain-containing protein n=2 Tax=Hymenobacter ruricola TaxID=2791023 RepID=A0ABS0I2C3_9BACT|nr:DUF4157 domain-containing protein [Hymenobacter ruricola]